MSSRQPRDWELVGGHPARGRPQVFVELARELGDTADRAENAHRRLVSLRDGTDHSIWRGRAAAAFRDQLGPMIENLAKLHESYARASQAMSTYGVRLAELQAEANAAVDDAMAADTGQRAAVESRDTAASADPGAAAAWEDAISSHGDRLRLARERIDRIREVAISGAIVVLPGVSAAESKMCLPVGLPAEQWGGLCRSRLAEPHLDFRAACCRSWRTVPRARPSTPNWLPGRCLLEPPSASLVAQLLLKPFGGSSASRAALGGAS